MSDNKAQFNFYLNRQGVTGKQGAKGEKGFSPVISVEKDTLSEYILRITNESSYFLTTNLRESKEDRGGTYIRYDRDQGVMYAGDADRANKTQYGEVRFATPEEITAGDEGTVLSPADVEDILANFVTTNTEQTITQKKKFMRDISFRGDILMQNSLINYNTVDNINPHIIEHVPGSNDIILGETKLFTSETYKNLGIEIKCDNLDNDAGIYTHRDGNVYPLLDSSNVIAGDNITIDKTATGITINSTGGGQVPEDVALKSADQTFTGHNWFNGQVNFNGTVQFTNQQVNIPKLYSANKITGVNISLDSAGQSYKFPCKKGTISLSATSGDYAGTTAGLYISGAGIDKKRLLTEGDAYALPQANATTLGGIKANPKTDDDTQAVNIDPATGLLYTKAGSGGSNNTVFDSVSPIVINQNCNPYIDNNGFYILENSYNNNGINNITVNDYNSIRSLPTSGTITLNIQNVTSSKTDWDNNVLGFNITNPNNAKIYAGDATQDFAKFIVLCNKSGDNITPLYIAVGDNSRVGAYYVENANSCLLNNIELQNIQDNKGIYNANIKQIINDTPYDMRNFFVIILVDLNIIQLMCTGADGEEHLLYNVSGLTDLANINYAYILSGSGVAKFHKDTVYSIVDGQKKYPTIIRNATDVNISLKYSNKFVLNNEALDLASTITTQGNTFNGASQLVQLDASGKLPAIDGSQLTNLPAGSSGFPSTINLTTPNFNNVITEGLYYWSGYTTPQNHPDGNASGYLMVLSLAGGFSVKQIFFEANGTRASEANTSNKMYMRVCLSNSSIGYDWSNWVQIATGDTSKMVTTDTSQTITGTKTFNNLIVDATGTGQRNILRANISTSSSGRLISNILTCYTDPESYANTLRIGRSFNTISIGKANATITDGNDNEFLTSANIPTGALKYWTGTEEAYTSITTKNADTLYRTTDTNKVYLGTIQLGGNT